MAEDDKSDDARRAAEVKEAHEKGAEKIKELEDDPPKNLEDWPSDAAKYETFGGGEGDHGYDEGPEKNLGPSGVRHHEEGSVTVDGEKVDNPDEFKGDPIPGGPTDPNASRSPGEERMNERREEKTGEADASSE